jgi:hypothetical protein
MPLEATMSHDNPDDVVTEVATRAMLRAVLEYVERNDPSAHAWINRAMRVAAGRMVPADEPEFRREVEDRAANLFFR